MTDTRITALEVHVLTGPAPARPEGDLQRQVTAAAYYDEHRPAERRPAPAADGSATARYLRIGTAGGAEGCYGPIDHEAVAPLLHQLRPALLGADALAVTAAWDRLARLDRHSLHGAYKIALSAVDNALWDLRGRLWGQPVWQLLGGSVRERVPAYVSLLGTSLDPDVVAETAARSRAEGFLGQKWFFGDGPAGGEAGLARNVALARTVREAVGPDADVMFDAFRGWDLPYALAWARRVEPLLPTWLEEPFQPAALEAYRALRRSTSIPLAAGEHLFDRVDALPYLQDHLLAMLQCDPEWCGGVTELVRICALAETFGVPVIPHGHGLHAALHVVASRPAAVCPKVEYLVRLMPAKHWFESDPPTPVGGSFALPAEPGFGITIDAARVDRREVLQA